MSETAPKEIDHTFSFLQVIATATSSPAPKSVSMLCYVMLWYLFFCPIN